MSNIEFLQKWKPTKECHYREFQDGIAYCNLGRTNCEFQGGFKIPYAHNSHVGGRKYECRKRTR